MGSRLGSVVGAGVLAGALVVGPSVVAPAAAPQASASFEVVENSASSESNISVRIWPGGGYSFDFIVGPDSGVNAGEDRISSYYIPRGVCASVNRGGVNIGVVKGPKRTYLAQGERIHTYAYPCP